MRDRRASRRASAPASRSSRRVRQSVATVARRATAATARTPSKSPGEAAAKPASITSTPSRSSCSATSAFSSGRRAMPGDCSPSLRVVSKIWILRELTTTSCQGTLRAYRWRQRWVYAPCGAWFAFPLEGENRKDEHDRPGPSGPGLHSAGNRGHPHPCRQSGGRTLPCQAALAGTEFCIQASSTLIRPTVLSTLSPWLARTSAGFPSLAAARASASASRRLRLPALAG